MMKAQPAFTGTTCLLPCYRQFGPTTSTWTGHANGRNISSHSSLLKKHTLRHGGNTTTLTMSWSCSQKQRPSHDNHHTLSILLGDARIPRRLFITSLSAALVSSGSLTVNNKANADELDSTTTTSLRTRLTLSAPGEPRAQPRGPFQALLNTVLPGSSEPSMTADLYYPVWFSGTWETTSTLRAVAAPAGYKLFGRAGAYEQAISEIDHSMTYKTRFIRSSDKALFSVADRGYNVATIAEATMGAGSVLQCTETSSGSSSSDDNVVGDLSLTVRPSQADGRVFAVRLKIKARAQQRLDDVPLVLGKGLRPDGGNVFEKGSSDDESEERETLWVSETVRQEVRRGEEEEEGNEMRGGNNSMLVKNVETTTVYIVPKSVSMTKGREEETTEIRAWQRTCSYLDRGELRATDARGRPVDVRWYELQYKRRGGRSVGR